MGSHVIFIYNSGSIMESTFAKNLNIGSKLVVSKGINYAEIERVMEITLVIEKGWLNPLTASGTILVNNISTSCYGSYPHDLAHLALLPARLLPSLLLDDEASQHSQGTRAYIIAIKRFSR